MRLSTIYAEIPSPPEVTFDPVVRYASLADRDMKSILANGDHVPGLVSNMYKYQYVSLGSRVMGKSDEQRSVARMMQMEDRPGRLIDPAFTAMVEPVAPYRTYYVDFATWIVRWNPGWYDLPRGGVL